MSQEPGNGLTTGAREIARYTITITDAGECKIDPPAQPNVAHIAMGVGLMTALLCQEQVRHSLAAQARAARDRQDMETLLRQQGQR